jgi:outer membrane protein assembly factor BamE (lipoprotein component of BamABCDE complex)
MRNVVLLASALLVGSCAAYDGYSLRPGESTESEVRQVMGAPAMEFSNPDGSRRLAYPRGPLGVQTYMADIRPDGRVEAIRPVLNDDVFFQVRPGLTRDEILRLIGPPGETGAFPRMRQYAWDYRFVDTWGYRAIFSVTFDQNDVVVSKFTRRLDREKGIF